MRVRYDTRSSPTPRPGRDAGEPSAQSKKGPCSPSEVTDARMSALGRRSVKQARKFHLADAAPGAGSLRQVEPRMLRRVLDALTPEVHRRLEALEHEIRRSLADAVLSARREHVEKV